MDMIGKCVLVRDHMAGVHVGTLSRIDGQRVELADARKLWRWQAAQGVSVHSVAVHGVIGSQSVAGPVVPWVVPFAAVEVVPVTETARSTIADCRMRP